MANKVSNLEPIEHNAQLNLWVNHEDGTRSINFDADKEACRQYHLQVVNRTTQRFESLEDKLDFLYTNDYYDQELFETFSFEQLKALYKRAYSYKHRFTSLIGAMKFYSNYALRTDDGQAILERFEDRVVANAVLLSQGNYEHAEKLVDEIISGRLQPATPTFSNAGKKRSGELVSCFLIDTGQDSMSAITRTWHSSAMLSKIGGGVGVGLTSLRAQSDPIKGIQNRASGLLPVAKTLDDIFSYVDQLGTRQGAGVVYVSIHHPDFMRILDAKGANADEKSRLKTLSVGAVVTSVAFELAKRNEDLYQFSPYDIERFYGKPMAYVDLDAEYYNILQNEEIRKLNKINARKLFGKMASTQFESGYPYLMFSKTVDEANPITDGRAVMSNLCSEILQSQQPSEVNDDSTYTKVGRDVSCNLASLNIMKTMNGGNIAQTVETAIRGLTAVSDLSDISAVPTVKRANEELHSVGLGQFSLHEFFMTEGLKYGGEESLDFTNTYFMTVAYYAYKTSMEIAKERGESFVGFENSKYADWHYLADKYADNQETIVVTDKTREIFSRYGLAQAIPSSTDWKKLAQDIANYGLYNAYLQAVPPTGSISYINGGTSSIHPATSPIEPRKEGSVGRVFYAAPGLTNENFDQFEDAYEVGYKRIIDVYAVAQRHIDQGMSLTLFYKDTDTTRDVNRAYVYAHKKGIKTLYYARVRSEDLEGTSVDECVSCTL